MPSYYSALGPGPEKPERSEARTFWDGDHRPGCFPAEFHFFAFLASDGLILRKRKV